LRDAAAAGCGCGAIYVTIDSWQSRAAYEEFQEKYATEYQVTDKKCEGRTMSETFLANTNSKLSRLAFALARFISFGSVIGRARGDL
jgi:hypothetical protein